MKILRPLRMLIMKLRYLRYEMRKARSKGGSCGLFDKFTFGIGVIAAVMAGVILAVGVGITIFEGKFPLFALTLAGGLLIFATPFFWSFLHEIGEDIKYDENSPMTFERFRTLYENAPESFCLDNIDDGHIWAYQGLDKDFLFCSKTDALEAILYIRETRDKRDKCEQTEDFLKLVNGVQEKMAREREEEEERLKKEAEKRRKEILELREEMDAREAQVMQGVS